MDSLLCGYLRFGKAPDEGRNECFGFVGSGLQPFNVGTFYRDRITSTYTLGDDAYRTFLMLKAAANISDTSVPTLTTSFSSSSSQVGAKRMCLRSGR